MTAEKIRAERAVVIGQYGQWTAHDIDLGHGVSTMDQGCHQQWRVDFFGRLIKRLRGSFLRRQLAVALGKARLSRIQEKIVFQGTRLLDLACLEGLFAIEFARMGAETVGLEIRDIHLAKAEFARRMLELATCRFVQGDVRAIPAELGQFDVIICAGILYHLDFPDCIKFLRDVADRSADLVIIDSHFAYDGISASVLPLTEMRTYSYDGQTYRGRAIVEHADHVTVEEKAKDHLWASIDNDISVWLDEADVVRILDEKGFNLVFRNFPFENYGRSNPDRPTLVFKRR